MSLDQPYGWNEAVREVCRPRELRVMHDQQQKQCRCFICHGTRERLGIKVPQRKSVPRQPWEVGPHDVRRKAA